MNSPTPEHQREINLGNIHLKTEEGYWVAEYEIADNKKYRHPLGLYMDKNNGTIGLTHGDVAYTEPKVRKLFETLVHSLEESQIEIPKPDPKFKRLEELIDQIGEDDRIDLNQQDLKIGDTILVLDVDNLSQPPENYEYIMYIGEISGFIPPLRTGPYPWSDKYIPLNFTDSAIRVDYAHFTPTEQHIRAALHTIYREPLLERNRQTQKWFPIPHRVTKEFVREVVEETKPYAIRMSDYGGPATTSLAY